MVKPKFRRFTSYLMISSLLLGIFPGLARGEEIPAASSLPVYLDPAQAVEARVSDLLGRMTLDEKVGQMVQAERASVTPNDVKQYFLGSVLSGGGSFPNGKQADSTAAKWADLVQSYQDGALSSRLGIPILYGVDAVHGNNNLVGATIFPHNIGIGATRDTALAEQIGSATAEEMRASGTNWAFAPTIADPQDIRWGRTYEGFSDNAGLVGDFGAAYVKGLQGETPSQNKDPLKVVATVKHFIGEGYTDNGTNQGNITAFTEGEILQRDLGVYKKAIDAGAMTVMASYSSIKGIKMHANQRLLTDVLKGTDTANGQLGFKGFVISDYNATQQITVDWNNVPVSGLKEQIRVAVNAGVDMFMMPTVWKDTITNLKTLVNEGTISQDRLNDAVSRILRVKFQSGLFENPKVNTDLTSSVGSAEHRALARKAVSESLVLLKNDIVGGSPIMSQLGSMNNILVAGKSANDIGIQSGGWTITWQGAAGNTTTGTTILQGIQNVVKSTQHVTYNKHGLGSGGKDVAIVVVGEQPYAETNGDVTSQSGLNLDTEDLATLKNVRANNPTIPIVVVLVSGRPLMISEQMGDWAGLVEAWLPGTEGAGVADVLFGSKEFTGKLPIRWPFYLSAYPMFDQNSSKLLFDFGYGLAKTDATPVLAPNPLRTTIPAAESVQIEAENYSVKSNALKVEDSDASEGTGAKNIGSSAANEFLDYPIDVLQGGTYSIDFRYASNPSSNSTALQILNDSGSTLGTLTVLTTGGPQKWQTETVKNIVLKPGKQTIRLKYIIAPINLNWFKLTRTGDSPVVPVTNVPADGTVVKFEAEDFSAKSDKIVTQDISEPEGTKNTGFAATGEWQEYSLNLEQGGTYTLDVRYASTSTTTGFKIINSRGENAGVFTTTVSTGAFSTYGTRSVTGIVLPDSGPQKLRIEYTNGSLNLNWFQLTRTGDVPTKTVVKAQAVDSWISSERDPVSRSWYYSSRYLPGDKKLEQQPAIDLVSPDSSTLPTTINVNPSVQYQSMTGIGTSVDESSINNLWKMSPAKRTELLMKMFDPINGAGLSMMRLTIGTADFTAQPFYSYDDMPKGQTDLNLEHFSIQKDKDFHIIQTIKQIQAINPDMKFFASAWSPPGWMKSTDSLIKGQVKDEYLPVLAKYYVKYLQAYQAEGINISALTMINEPLLEIEYPSTKMPWQQQAQLSKLLRAELDNNHFENVKIWIFDHNPSSTASYPTPILADSLANAAVDGTAFHDYGGDLSLMTTLHNQFPTKNVYLTERAVWGTVGADRMAQYFRNWAKSYNSWVFMLDSDIASHQWTGTPDPTPIVQDSNNPDNYWLLPEFYLLGQYTKFVKPDYIRIDSNNGTASTVTNVSFMSPDSKKLVTVAINQTNKPQAIKIVSEGAQFNAVIPAQSVATYRWDRLGTNNIINTVKLSSPTKVLPYEVSNSTVSLKLEAGTFNPANISAITVTGSGVTEGGVSIQSRTVVSPTQVDLTLAWNGTVYNKDLKLTFNVPASAYADSSAGVSLSTDITLRGTDRIAATNTLITDPIDLTNYAQKNGVTGVAAGNLSGIATGDWIDYKVDVPASGKYIVTMKVVANTGGTLLLNDGSGNNLASFVIPSLGNANAVQVRSALSLQGGTQKLRIYAGATDANVKIQNVSFELVTAQIIDPNAGLQVAGESYVNAVPTPIIQIGTFKNLGYTSAGMKLDYLLTVPQDGYYTMMYNYATPQSGVSVSLASDNNVIRTTALPSTGAWGTYKQVSDVVQLTAGTHTIQLALIGDGINLQNFILTPNAVPPVVTGKLPRVASDLASGVYTGTKTFSLSTVDSGASIYYTTDGSLPSASSNAYTGPITIASPTFIRTIAIKSGWQDSDVSAFSYSIVSLTPAEVAAGLTTIAAPAQDATTLVLPIVPAGFTVAIKDSENLNVIALNGTIIPPSAATTVKLVLTVTRSSDGLTADTAEIQVNVPAKSVVIPEVTAASVAASITTITAPLQDVATLTLPAVPVGFTVVIKSVDPTIISTDGSITLPDEETTIHVVLTVSRIADGSSADTAPITVIVPAKSVTGPTAASIAANLTFIDAPLQDATALILPTVPVGFSVAIKSSTDSTVVGLNGMITPPNAATTVHLVLTVTGPSDSADTAEIIVLVPAKSVVITGPTAEAVAAGLTAITSPLRDAKVLILPTVPAGFSVTIKSSDSDVVVTNGTITPPNSATIVHLVLTVTKLSDGTTADTISLTLNVPPRSVVVTPPVDNNNSNSGGTGTEPPIVEQPGVQVVSKDELSKPAENGKVTVAIKKETDQIVLPTNAAALLGKNVLVLQADSLSLTVPSELLQQLIGGLSDTQLADSKVILKVERLSESQKAELLAKGQQSESTQIKVSGEVFDLKLVLVSKDGQETNVTKLDKPITIHLKVDASLNASLSAIYYIDDNGKLEYIGGKLIGGEMVAEIHHFSKYAVLEFKKTFADVPSTHWALDAIQQLASKQIVNGTSETTFAPTKAVTRAEFTSMLVRALNLSEAGELSFQDVSSEAWYADAVSKAVKAGIVTGKSAALFDPNGQITREEMVVMMMRAYVVIHGTVEQGAASTSFKDESKISSWALESVRAAAGLHLISGRTSEQFDPSGITSRAEAAVALNHLLQ